MMHTKTAVCLGISATSNNLLITLPNELFPWQNWMAAYLGYTLQMKRLFRGWPVMVHDTHMRRRWAVQ